MMLTQAIHVTTTIPQPVSTVQYLILLRDSVGDFYPETSKKETVRDLVVNDVAGRQIGDRQVRQVVAFDLTSGNCWDASAEIARDAIEQCFDLYGEIPSHCRDFLEDVLGVHHVRACELEAAA